MVQTFKSLPRIQYNCSTEFGSLTQAQLMDKVRALQNMAYQLGVEEGEFKHVSAIRPTQVSLSAKEMSRGKCLDVFQIPESSKLKY